MGSPFSSIVLKATEITETQKSEREMRREDGGGLDATTLEELFDSVCAGRSGPFASGSSGGGWGGVGGNVDRTEAVEAKEIYFRAEHGVQRFPFLVPVRVFLRTG